MNPRRYSHQMERALSVLNGSVTTDILKDDQYLLFLLKKTERVVAALYVVTGSFQDIEPLKWSIRESGTLLIKHVLSLKERTVVHSQDFLSDTHAEITRILSSLDLAHIADLLSPMNFSVLKDELEGLVNIIESKWRVSNLPTSQARTLQEDFFGISRNIFSVTKKENKNNMFLSNSQDVEQNNEETTPLRALADFERFRRSQKDISKGQIQTTENVLYEKAQGPRQRAREHSTGMSLRNSLLSLSKTKEDRMQNIIAVLRKQASATIKDFSAMATECSEKTIQRLLIEMVQSGVLKRSGSRRWSRYSIV